MEKNKDYIFFRLVLLVLILIGLVSLWQMASETVKRNREKEENRNLITYAIIFYPDNKTTVEGPVDEFSLGKNATRVTINGVEYITSSENVIITNRKTFNVEVKK